jgi:hypothetical protein
VAVVVQLRRPAHCMTEDDGLAGRSLFDPRGLGLGIY